MRLVTRLLWAALLGAVLLTASLALLRWPNVMAAPGILPRLIGSNGLFVDSGQSLGASTTWDVALADVDRDGDLDALTANSGEGAQVWQNNGGAFTLSQTLFANSADIYAVAFGDVDNDGDPDAVLANRGGGNQVWLNSGGSFTDSGQSLGASQSTELALGDLNRDGRPDIVFGNGNDIDQPSRIWLNTGSGVFTDSGQTLITARAWGVAINDLNGDGNRDIIVATSPSNSVAYFTNISGTIVGTSTLPALPGTIFLATGDVDNDGDIDAVVGNLFTIQVNNNDGNGNFSPGSNVTVNNPHAIELGDVDKDGDLDLVVGVYNGGVNLVFFNDGGGNFSDSGQQLGSRDSQAVALGDVDKDGDLDIFFGNFTNQADQVWLNQSSRSSTEDYTRKQRIGGYNVRGMALADVNGDGSLDAVFANASPNEVWLNNGSGQFLTSLLFGTESSQAIQLEDLDNDGDADAVVGNAGTTGQIWLNDGAGSFTLTQTLTGLTLSDTTAIALGDLTNNGVVDAVVAGSQGSGLLFNNGNGTFVTQTLSLSASQAVALGDLDRDGKLDIFVANNGDNRVWQNGGSGVFNQQPGAPGSADSRAVALGDLDRNGTLDAFVGNLGGNEVWLNNGGGQFSLGTTLGQSNTVAVALADFEQDGDLDALEANAGGQAGVLWLNDGRGQFSRNREFATGGASAIAIGDINGDSVPDFIIGGDSSGGASGDVYQSDNTWAFDADALGTSQNYARSLTLTVDIPAAALDTTTHFTYTFLPSPARPISPELQFAGWAFVITPTQGGQPVGDPLNGPMTMTLHHFPQGLFAKRLQLYYWDEANQVWVDAAKECGSYVTGVYFVRVPVCHFTEFALLQTPAAGGSVFLPVILKNR
ncbi:MAG: hypothetical protein Kow0031_16640 [Anaerolineae bacterium]